MTAANSRDIPLWRDFSSFSLLLSSRLRENFDSLLRGARECIGKLFSLLVLFKARLVSALMLRRNRWLTDRLNWGSVFSFIALSFLFVPQVQSVSFRNKLRTKLELEGTLGSNGGCGGMLVQNNAAVTSSGDSRQRAEVIEYEIRPGDTLFDIGKRFNVTVDSLAYINDLSNKNYLAPGTVIKIPPVSGVIHKVASGETVSTIAHKWGVSPQVIVDSNWLDEPFTLRVGEELVVPTDEVPSRLASAAAADRVPVEQEVNTGATGGLQLFSVGANSTGRLGMPSSGRITQYFSWRHPAIDVAANCGAPVVAADGGEIVFAAWWPGGGGYSIWVDHGNGYLTKYAHLMSFKRRSGAVSKGEVIGYMGATGRAYGCHTHFIVQRHGRYINPLSVIR